MMKIYLFVFGLLVTSSSAIRGHEIYARLTREVAVSDEEIVIDTPKVTSRRLDRNLHGPTMAPSMCNGKGGKKGGSHGKGHIDDGDIPYSDSPQGVDVESTTSDTATEAVSPTAYATDTATEAVSPTAAPTAYASHTATEAVFPTASPTAYATGDGIADGANGEGSPENGTETSSPSSSASTVPDVLTTTTENQAVPTRVLSCDGDDSALVLTPKYIGYEYSVKTVGEYIENGEKYTLNEVLDAIESVILYALLNGNVLNCNDTRRLEANVHRRLAREVVRISSDPPDRPYNNVPVDCEEGEDCNILIQGNLTAYFDTDADDQPAQNVIECDIITLIQKLLTTMSAAEIKGVENITYIGAPMCETPDAASTSITEETYTSNNFPAGLVVGAAVGGMCMVLIGLLVVRQRMTRRREDDTIVNGNGMVKDNSRSLSVTVDQSVSHQTFDVTPTSTNPDGTILGLSASQDTCCEWGGAKDKFSDIETACERANLETSDDTIIFERGTPETQPESPDPPSMDCGESVHFEPTVKEEEHLTHDVRF